MLNATAARQRGMSLVELMVGITVGLFVAAAASMLAAMQLGDNRRLLQEAQLMQDLRAAADLVGRELRRSGSKGATDEAVWLPGKASLTLPAEWDDVSPTGAAGSQVDFTYLRENVFGGQLGFKLEGERIKTLLAGKVSVGRLRVDIGWQELTDPNTVRITRFAVTPLMADEPTPAAPAPSRMPCPRLCADGSMTCWPEVRIRQFRIDIAGTSPDGSVQRTAASTVRLRNNELRLHPSEANPIPAGQVCPD